MPYNTNNPVPSSDLRDFFDNSQTLDDVVNSGSNEVITRTGKKVKTLTGIQEQVTQIGQSASQSAQSAAGSAAAAAQSAADAAGSAAATGYVAPPFPDVWAPLSDSLQLLAGVAPADTITVGGTSFPLKTKSLSFSRASTATYIDKSGVLQTAAVNEPRFEKEGLLIEGQSTNYFRYSNDPSQWKSTGNTASALNVSVINDGNTKAPTGMFTLTADSSVLTLIGHTGTPIQVAVGDVVSASCRVKIPSNCRVRVRYGNSQGYVTGIYYDSVGNRIGTEEKTTNNSVVLGSDGYLTIKSSYIVEAADANFFVSFLMYDVNNVNNNIATGAVFYLQMPQAELNIPCSSFIITTSSVATRAADIPLLDAINGGFDNVTIACTVTRLWAATSPPNSAPRIFSSRGSVAGSAWDTAFNNIGSVNSFGGQTNAGALVAGFVDGQVFTSIKTPSGLTTMTPTGKTSGSQTTSPGFVSPLYLGNTKELNRPLFGHIRNLRIWHSVLSDIQIKGLR